MDDKLKIGDLLYRDKGLVTHVGVYLGGARVAHIQPGRRAHITTLETYAAGKSVRVIRDIKNDPMSILARVQQALTNSEAYNLLTNNCEHLANQLVHGKRWSPQVQATAIGAIVGGLVMPTGKNGKWAEGAIVGGLISLFIFRATQQSVQRIC